MNDETERALDEYLIAFVQCGSREAFDRLVRRWTPKLLRYSARVLGRPELAPDIVQETWVAAIRGMKKLEDPSRFPAWIYSIAHRRCVDGIRFNQRQRRLIASVGHEAVVASAGNQNRPEPGDQSDLTTAISQLNQERREVVHLFYGEDLSIDERIQKALSSEDHAFLALMDADGSFYRDIAATFRGHTRWLNALAFLFAFALLGAGVMCGWQFATQTDLRSMQLWSVGTILSFLALGLIKLWFWMELQKVSVVREIKRVELQLAILTAELRSSKTP